MHREFYTRLISREHPLPEAFVPEHLIDIGLPFEAAPGDPKRLLEYQAAKAASQLFHACHRCGLNLWAVSGYRSYQRQKELFTGSPFVAEPGTSEHQSGLALDVSCPSIHMELSERFSATGEGRWLKKNAPLYGFILRYPKSKEEITGIGHEPWHFRYVGQPHAAIMEARGLTLEEYIAWLREFPYESCRYQEKNAIVSFLPGVSDGPTILKRDSDLPCTISGNNVDGFIITEWRRAHG